MGQDMGAKGGSVHPGKPVIWPTGKPTSQTISSPNQTETPGGIRGIPTKTAPTRPGEVAPAQTAAAAPTAAPARPAPSIARPLTVEDVRSHLMSLQIEANDFNTQLASSMLRNGVELSRTNFVKMMSMLQGSNNSQAMQEAAMLLLMKGIDSPQAAKILGQYFSENPALAQQMMGLQEGIGTLMSALGAGKGLLDTTLVAQLSALLSQFDENLQNITSKFQEKGINHQNMLSDVRALKALLSGVQDKAKQAESGEAKALNAALMESSEKLNGVMQNLLAQGILSQTGRQEVNYLYHQVPNPMTNPAKDLEIMIKRDGEGPESQVDPRRTQIVMSLETTNLGRLVVSMYIKDDKVYAVFVFAKDEHGDKGRTLIARDFADLQEQLAKHNYQITGYQVKVDPNMCNIKPYLIPMLPGLDSILKKIDIEA